MLTIVDYGSGNLRSVQKACERLGVAARITADPDLVGQSDRLILPGVGAFADAIQALRARGLVDPILTHVRADRPFFGICMGLQLLFEKGWEGGAHAGLGVLPGEVTRFEVPAGLKVPHMGWNMVDWTPAAAGLGVEREYYYFVHAYHARPRDQSVVAAVTDYGGPFCSAVRQGRLFATQFHPEKSQSAGLRLLATFLEST